MEKIFLGALCGMVDKTPEVIRCIHAVLDFIYYVHFKVHCDGSLQLLDEAWVMLHQNKKIFKELEI